MICDLAATLYDGLYRLGAHTIIPRPSIQLFKRAPW